MQQLLSEKNTRAEPSFQSSFYLIIPERSLADVEYSLIV